MTMTAQERTADYLRSLGIDPADVLVDSVSERSYLKIVRDSHGDRILSNGGTEVATVKRLWPSVAVGRQVVKLLHGDMTSIREDSGFPPLSERNITDPEIAKQRGEYPIDRAILLARTFAEDMNYTNWNNYTAAKGLLTRRELDEYKERYGKLYPESPEIQEYGNE